MTFNYSEMIIIDIYIFRTFGYEITNREQSLTYFLNLKYEITNEK